MKAFLNLCFAAAIFCLQLPAQLALGTMVPTTRWQNWSQGAPIVLGSEAAPACTAFVFYGRATHAADFAADGDYLAQLQKTYGERGLAVVAVVGDAKPSGAERWPGCRIVVDEELATTNAWFGDAELPWHAVVVDHAGRLTFFGSLEAGLVDAIELTLQGHFELAVAQTAYATRSELPLQFDDLGAEVARRQLEPLLAHAPHDGLAWALLYLTQATKFSDVTAAMQVRSRAIEALAGQSRPLGAFASLAMRGDPRASGLAGDLVGPLKAAAAGAPNDVVVQLAYLRALVLTGADREVGRQAMRVRKPVLGSAEYCLEFAALLTQDKDAVVHRDLASQAVERAAALGAPARLLAAARYGVALRCGEDRAEALRLLEAYLGEDEQHVLMNNDCWFFMTQLPTMGRYDWFAAGLADRMLLQRDAMEYFEFDTVALAMFQVGRFEEAVRLQETAIEKGGKDNPEYLERLQRYKARVLPAPR